MAAGDDLNGVAPHVRVRTPMLAIFPGTTAAHAALEFMQHARDLPEGDRRRIALIYIDIDHLHPELVAFRSRHAGMFNEKIIRIGVPRHVAHIPRFTQEGDADEPHTYIPPKLPDAYENGARGIRNNGHVAFCHNVSEITKNVTEAITQITSREVNQGLPEATSVQVHISAFVGGGTASGIVADLACLARQLLVARDLDPRITMTCILPTGVSSDDSDLRRSNAVACMLEILALSLAQSTQGGRYRKYLRARYHELPAGPIAHEVYLIGDAKMTDTRDIARIAGMDLFQRTLDASGVGALERSEAVNRISLGQQDDRGLPTMFGTACPLEARFPVAETALAFAQMAASHVLPLLAGYRPAPPPASDAEQEGWRRRWNQVAQVQSSQADPRAVPMPELPPRQYEQLDSARVERLWARVKHAESAITQRVESVLGAIRTAEEARIEEAGGVPEERERRWQLLHREYEVALADAAGQPRRALNRPTSLEQRATGWLNRRAAERRLHRAHLEHLRVHAQNERRRLLEALLRDLLARVATRIAFMRELAQRADADRRAAELRLRAERSAAWRAHLDRPHPFQMHLLDLIALGRTDRGSPAVERLYEQVTATIMGSDERGEPNYDRFLPEIAGLLEVEGPEQDAEQFSRAVVRFFEPRYVAQLRTMCLPQLLAAAGPDERRRPIGQRPVDQALAELMQWLKTHMTGLVTFDQRIGGEQGSEALKTEVFLGAGTGDDGDDELVKDASLRADLLRSGADHYRRSFDPHRLQASYQQHGISLAAIYDFFSPVNSAMERYLRYQQAWRDSARSGNPPPHACGELERLVLDQRLVQDLVRHAAIVSGRPPQEPAHGSGSRAVGAEEPLP